MNKTKPMGTTLTNKVSAIQVKMLHLQFRMKKILEDQAALIEKSKKFKSNRETIRGLNNSAYTLIDMLISMEHMYQLMKDFFSTKELTQHFEKDTFQLLNNVKKISLKWKFVRNKLGGHIDSSIVELMCKKHNFVGVFLSEDLECDLGVLNILLIESAINESRNSSDIFGRDLSMKDEIAKETKIVVAKLNEDWKNVFSYFEPMMKLLYRVGKQEKITATKPEERTGIVTGD